MPDSEMSDPAALPDMQALLAQALKCHAEDDLLQADALFRDVLALDPANFIAIHQMGVIRNQCGDFSGAFQLLSEALKIQPRSALAHLDIGISCRNLGRVEEALSHFEYSLIIKPGNIEACLNRALALNHLGRTSEAEPVLRQALALNAEAYAQAVLEANNDLAGDPSSPKKRTWLGALLKEWPDLPSLYAMLRERLIFFYPPYIEIETINVCNAACVMCPASDKSRQAKVMSMALYQKIIDEIAAYPNPPAISLHGIGEPMLDRMLGERVAYARECGLPYVSIVTNGSLLAEDKARAILEAGIDGVTISIESINPVLYAKIRVNLELEEVVSHVVRLAELRDALRPKLSINIARVLYSDSEEEAQAFEQFWRDRLRPGLDKVFSFPRHNFALGYDSDFAPGSMPCSKPFEAMNIRSDGTIPLCCVDNSNTYNFGNVQERSVLDLYNEPGFHLVRWRHLAGSRPHLTLCAGCNVPEAGEPSVSITL